MWFVFAQAGPSLAEELPGIGILGGSVIGIMLILGLLGWVWFKPAVDDLRARLTKTEEQRDALIQTWEDKALPFLTDQREKVIPMLGEQAVALREIADVLKDVGRDMAELKRQPRGQGSRGRT